MIEKWIALGMLLIFLGFFIIIGATLYGAYKSAEVSEEETEIKGGGIVMIGPIPIIFGTDAGSVKILMIMAIVLMIIALLLLNPFWRI